jgi:hypothetical protein
VPTLRSSLAARAHMRPSPGAVRYSGLSAAVLDLIGLTCAECPSYVYARPEDVYGSTSPAFAATNRAESTLALALNSSLSGAQPIFKRAQVSAAGCSRTCVAAAL